MMEGARDAQRALGRLDRAEDALLRQRPRVTLPLLISVDPLTEKWSVQFPRGTRPMRGDRIVFGVDEAWLECDDLAHGGVHHGEEDQQAMVEEVEQVRTRSTRAKPPIGAAGPTQSPSWWEQEWTVVPVPPWLFWTACLIVGAVIGLVVAILT
jgi:hypothetical protein